MSPPILLAEFDWNQVFYFLIPLVYVAAQFFGGDKDKEAKKKAADGKTPSAEVQDRLRKVQEEIRRKVAERQEEMRRAAEGAEAPSAARADSARPMTGDYDPTLPEWAQRNAGSQPTTRVNPPPIPRRSDLQPEVTLPPVPPMEPQESSLDKQLREQRSRLERARLEREAAFAKTRDAASAVRVAAGKSAHVSSVRHEVLLGLRSPVAARTAIVLSEILGPPRATRPFEERG